MSKPIRVFIVEDEPLIADTIELALSEVGYEPCGWADHADDAMKGIRNTQPDIALLDISIDGDVDGIELAEKINAEFGIPFIFLTSYTDKVTINRVKKCNPAGFISKPFQPHDLHSNIEIALYKTRSEATPPLPGNDHEPDYFFIRQQNKMLKIAPRDIHFAEASDNYTYLHTATGRHLLSVTLKQVEDKLSGIGFIRIHKSYMVNLNHIDMIAEGQVYCGEHRLTIGRAYKEKFMERLSFF